MVQVSKGLIVGVVIACIAIGAVMGLLVSYHPSLNPYTLPTPTPTIAPTTTPSPTVPTEFTFGTFNPESGNLPPVVRGTTSSLKVLISLNKLWSEETKPTFTADTGTSGIECVFSSASWFQEWMFVSVPYSTQAGTYTVTITASNTGTTHTTTYEIIVKDP